MSERGAYRRQNESKVVRQKNGRVLEDRRTILNGFQGDDASLGNGEICEFAEQVDHRARERGLVDSAEKIKQRRAAEFIRREAYRRRLEQEEEETVKPKPSEEEDEE